MPRKLVELSDVNPYHIYARSNNKDWFALPLGYVYLIYEDVIKRTVKNYGFAFHSFVLMSNHFHALVSTPKANLSEGMRYFMTESSRSIARASGRINRIYGARYKSTIIKSSIHYAHAYKYVYRNPVEAGVCDKALNYEFSTLNSKCRIKVEDNSNGFNEHIPDFFDELIEWLDDDPGEKFNNDIRKALRRREFKIPKPSHGGKRPTYVCALRPKKMPGTF